MAGCALVLFGTYNTAGAAPLCAVEFSLPSGSAAEMHAGESATFAYSATVTAAEVHLIDLQIVVGSTSGMTVDIQPQSTSFDVTPTRAPQTYPVSGSITVSVPGSFEAGRYTVSGLGAVATCTTRAGDGGETRSMGRGFFGDLTITVARPVEPTPTPVPEPTDTPTPEPTSTPVPPPAICEPGLALAGAVSIDVTPGSRVSVPFEASVVVRRVSQASLTVSASYQGPLGVSIDPPQQSFSFDPLPSDAVLRTFSGSVSIAVPSDQPPGSYTINDLTASASCQAVDSTGAPTSIADDSASVSIMVRLAAPTATPSPRPTITSLPSPTAPVSPSVTSSPTAPIAPSATRTATASPTSTRTGTVTPTPPSIPGATAIGTSTPSPASAATATSTQRGVVRSPSAAVAITSTTTATAMASPTATSEVVVAGVASGSIVLDWTEDRETVASQQEDESYVELILGAASVLLIAGGSYGAWRARGGSTE